MGGGDWNDGMNRVGRGGRGESVWLGFFLYDALGRFLPLCAARGDEARVRNYEAYRRRLSHALDSAGWDGQWYRRAYYDDGTPLGSADSDECRIDAIAQAWAVLSGVASPGRARAALDALERHLVDETAGLIRLLTPPFDRTPHDPGYIKAYVPGVRENGGQYTHGALWAIRALLEAGRHETGARLLERITPVWHTASADAVRRYRTEPYVIAADVYGEPPHVGRGGWTWYTGSAGWLYRVILESLLGFRIREGRWIELRPRIPRHWPGYRIRYRLPGDDGTVYDIEVRRNAGGPAFLKVDGAARPLSGDGRARVPILRDGKRHPVVLLLNGSPGRSGGR
jgi:cyclic beta-1,2-glucan synthetase